MKIETFKFKPLFGEIEFCEILARTDDSKPAVLWTCHRMPGQKWHCPITRVLKPNASHAWERQYVDTVTPEAIAEADKSETHGHLEAREWENWLYGRLDDKRLAPLKDYLDNDPRADNLLDAVFSSQAGEILIDLPQEKA